MLKNACLYAEIINIRFSPQLIINIFFKLSVPMNLIFSLKNVAQRPNGRPVAQVRPEPPPFGSEGLDQNEPRPQPTSAGVRVGAQYDCAPAWHGCKFVSAVLPFSPKRCYLLPRKLL